MGQLSKLPRQSLVGTDFGHTDVPVDRILLSYLLRHDPVHSGRYPAISLITSAVASPGVRGWSSDQLWKGSEAIVIHNGNYV